jgi:hypothetical protein
MPRYEKSQRPHPETRRVAAPKAVFEIKARPPAEKSVGRFEG